MHDMMTHSGQSGSPILRVATKEGKQFYEVVGLHTHRGTDYKTNEGLVLSE